ncbi:phage tail assembly protein [Cloacibacillus sp.]|uniref:phage tail assembly protein n=1 Tax=Cloacibacillus sp. TaxID=2049023 RepID=UPI0025B92D66|nr:phage tail assembly protein [Cloacibacillus sp.]
MGNSITGPCELNKKFQSFFAATLAGVKPDFIAGLPMADFSRITLYCQRFLLGQD